MNGQRRGITERQQEAALRFNCGEPPLSIARAMGLKHKSCVRNLLVRFEARGGSVEWKRKPNRRIHPQAKQERNADLVARVPFEPMPSLAARFGITQSRAEQIVVAYESRTGTVVTRFRESRFAVNQVSRGRKQQQRRAAQARRKAERLEFLDRVAELRQQGLVASEVCRKVGVDARHPASTVNSWLRQWERLTGNARYPGQIGRRPRKYAP